MCQKTIGFVRISHFDDDDIKGYDLKCHQWACPECSKVLKNKLLDRINQGLKGIKKDFYFLTLTSSYREMNIKKSWNHFRHRLNSSYPIHHYVWIMEITPPSHLYIDWRGKKRVSVGGLRHFHVLISFENEVPENKKIQHFWKKSTNNEAWEVHFEQLEDIKNPAGYLAKYLTKALTLGYAYNEKRIGFSKGFPKYKSNMEPQKGVYLPYNPLTAPKTDSTDFDKMLKQIAQEKYQTARKRYL